jgi:outer membrane protein
MTVSAPVVVLGLVLSATPAFAQAPAAPPAPRPAAPAVQAPAVVPVLPFPAGVKYAFVNVQRIAGESAEGKVATGQVQALNNKKVEELNGKNKQLQSAQQKLESGGTVLSATAVAQLQKEIERVQIDIQRFTEDAQQEVNQLQQQLQDDFQRKLSPVIQEVATERQLHMLFSVGDSGLVWGDPSLDLTPEIIKRFDASAPAASTRPASAPAPAQPRPAAPGTGR